MELHVRSASLVLLGGVGVQATKHANHGQKFANLGTILWMESVVNALQGSKELETDLLVSSAPLALLGGVGVQATKHANHGQMFANLGSIL
jgi:hypothetical protein